MSIGITTRAVAPSPTTVADIVTYLECITEHHEAAHGAEPKLPALNDFTAQLCVADALAGIDALVHEIDRSGGDPTLRTALTNALGHLQRTAREFEHGSPRSVAATFGDLRDDAAALSQRSSE